MIPKTKATPTPSAGSQPQWHTCRGGFDGFASRFAVKQELPFEDLGCPLGQGAFGKVRRVRSTVNHAEYALKEIAWSSNKARLEMVLKEIRIHRRLEHRHITSVVGTFTRGKYSCGILLQPVADYDLGEYLHRVLDKLEYHRSIAEDVKLLSCSFGCLASGLAYLHWQKIKHKDIKPANILIHGESVLLTDFGISTEFSPNDRSTSTGPTAFSREVMQPLGQPPWSAANVIMCLQWAAPEVLTSDLARNTSADVFSLGCVFVEILTVMAGMSLSDFKELRQKAGDSTYANNIETTLHWVRGISESLPGSLRAIASIIESTLPSHPNDRSSAADVWTLLRFPRRDGTSMLCGPCCRSSYESPSSTPIKAEHMTTAQLNPSLGSKVCEGFLRLVRGALPLSPHRVALNYRPVAFKYEGPPWLIYSLLIVFLMLLFYLQSVVIGVCSVLMFGTVARFAHGTFNEMLAFVGIWTVFHVFFVEK